MVKTYKTQLHNLEVEMRDYERKHEYETDKDIQQAITKKIKLIKKDISVLQNKIKSCKHKGAICTGYGERQCGFDYYDGHRNNYHYEKYEYEYCAQCGTSVRG